MQQLENATKTTLPATYLEVLKELAVKEEALLLVNIRISELEIKVNMLLDRVNTIKASKHNNFINEIDNDEFLLAILNS